MSVPTTGWNGGRDRERRARGGGGSYEFVPRPRIPPPRASSTGRCGLTTTMFNIVMTSSVAQAEGMPEKT
ncbi:hypothetical protein MINT15_04310 [Saccharomonospora viridis]|uniref:Uncharacterized protein n=1 Tax=Saccharomonospora viridis TaxID=1852 RepID=A0A837DFD5_9PSEU|nr:hypothetical protein MINT15_04310 [Saccharomonospora viridis]